jgi:hypothetical protein
MRAYQAWVKTFQQLESTFGTSTAVFEVRAPLAQCGEDVLGTCERTLTPPAEPCNARNRRVVSLEF